MIIDRSDIKWFAPILLVINTPSININFGISSIHLYLLISLILIVIMLYEYKHFTSLHVTPMSLVLLIIIFSLFILFNGRDDEIVNLGNSALSSDWQVLYGKKEYNDFYRDQITSLFQLVNFIIWVVVFHFFYNVKVNYAKYLDLMSLLLWISLIIQLLSALTEVFTLGVDRPSGTFGNAQSLSFFMNVIIAWFLSINKPIKITNFIAITIAIFTIYVSGTRSGMAIAGILILTYYIIPKGKMIKLIFLNFSLSLAVTFTLLFSYSDDFREFVLLILTSFTSPLTMNLRGLMWNSFSYIFPSASLLGTYGITVYFTDNFFWFFCISYGVCGLLFLFIFFKGLIKNSLDNKFILLITLLIVIQSISYYGFFVENLGWSLVAIIGLEFKRNYIWKYLND